MKSFSRTFHARFTVNTVRFMSAKLTNLRSTLAARAIKTGKSLQSRSSFVHETDLIILALFDVGFCLYVCRHRIAGCMKAKCTEALFPHQRLPWIGLLGSQKEATTVSENVTTSHEFFHNHSFLCQWHAEGVKKGSSWLKNLEKNISLQHIDFQSFLQFSSWNWQN